MVDSSPDAPAGPAKPVRAYVGLGSNMGDREANIKRAVEHLGRCEGIKVVRVSSFLETDPVGGPPGQPKYLNAAAALDTELSPRELLEACMDVEREVGRTRGPDDARWGPRVIDVDILLYGDLVLREEGLEIPHPRMRKRAFVLAPLVEIAGEARHPLAKATVAELARDVPVKPEGAVSAYLHLRCGYERFEAVRAACAAHERITVVGCVLRGECGQVPFRCEEAFLEVYTTLSLRAFLDFCDGLAKELGDAGGEARPSSAVVLLHGTERDAGLGIPHPSLHEEAGVLQGLAHLAPYAWLPDVEKTAGELADERETLSRQVWHRAARDPGRN